MAQAAASTRTAPAVAQSPKPLENKLNELLDTYYDYNDASLRQDALVTLNKNSESLKALLAQFPTAKFVVAGNCDERGSAEYNMALGDRRAHAASEFLTQVGVPSDRLTTISYGKERPVCEEHNEACWQRNRRAQVAEAR